MGGESNITFDLLLDKSTHDRPHLKQPPKQSLRIARLLHDLGLIDTCRELNPTSKDYTHYSAPHKMYARIDHIFIPNSEIHTATHASIHEVPWSEHSLVILRTTSSLSPPGPPQWRPSESLLSNPVHCIMLEKDIREFFLINDTGGTTQSNLWGAHTAILRGK